MCQPNAPIAATLVGKPSELQAKGKFGWLPPWHYTFSKIDEGKPGSRLR